MKSRGKRSLSMALAVALVFSLITFGAPLKASAAVEIPKTNFGNGVWDLTIKTANVYQAGTTGWVRVRLIYMKPDGSLYLGQYEAVHGDYNGGMTAGEISHQDNGILEHPSYMVYGFQVVVDSKLNDWLPEWFELKLSLPEGGFYTIPVYNTNNEWCYAGKWKNYDIRSRTLRKPVSHGGYDNLGGEDYISAVSTGTETKHWDGRGYDATYEMKYNMLQYENAPDFTCVSTQSIISAKDRFKVNAYSGATFSYDRNEVYRKMVEANIGKVEFNYSLAIPPALVAPSYATVHNRKLTIYRTCFTLGAQDISTSPTFRETVPGTTNQYNYYFNEQNRQVRVTMEPTSIHMEGMGPAVKAELGKSLSCNAALYNGNAADAAKLCDMTKSVDRNGVITFVGTLPMGIDTKVNGVMLKLTDLYTTFSGRRYTLNDGSSQLTQYFSQYKADTISPKISVKTINNTADDISNKYKQSHKFWLTSEERISSDIGGAAYELRVAYSLYKQQPNSLVLNSTPSAITDNGGNGSHALVSEAISTTVLKNAPINLKLATADEGIYTLTFASRDKAGNPCNTRFQNVFLDNKPPQVSVTVQNQNQAPDGTKSVACPFTVTDFANGYKNLGAWSRVYYCFVKQGESMPAPDEGNAQSGIIDTVIGKWAFFEGGNDVNTAQLKIKKGEKFDGTLYFYGKDSAGNITATQTRPVSIRNDDAVDPLIYTASSNAKPSYDIRFDTSRPNITTSYFWSVKDAQETFTQNPKNYTAGAPVGGANQVGADGKSYLLNGIYTLNYTATNTASGNRTTYQKDFTFDNAIPSAEFTWKTASGSLLESQQVSIKMTDLSGLVSATYQIVNTDGTAIDGQTPVALALTQTADGRNQVSETPIIATPQSGVYCVKLHAVDNNGGTLDRVMEGKGFAIRAENTEIAELTDGITTKLGGTSITKGPDYTLTLKVREPMKNAAALNRKQTVEYRISADGVSYGQWTPTGVVLTADGNALTGTCAIQTPVPLKEGGNKFYVQAVVTNSGSTGATSATYASADKTCELICDKTAPTAKVTYDNTIQTKNPVKATVTVADAATGLTGAKFSVSEGVSFTKVSDGVYGLNFTENKTCTATIEDCVGNKTTVDISVKNIDKEPPAITLTAESVTDGARQDADITVQIDGAVGSSVKFGLVGDGITEEPYTAFQAAGFIAEKTGSTPSDFPGETDDTYVIRARGKTGTYHIQVYAQDNVGNTLGTLPVSDSFTIKDAASALVSNACVPETTMSTTTATVQFNTVVAVLPPALATGKDETENQRLAVENKNKAFKNTFQMECSDKTEKTLYAVDRCGRAYTFKFIPSATFTTGYPITQQFTKNDTELNVTQPVPFTADDTVQLVVTHGADYADKQHFTLVGAEYAGFTLDEANSVKIVEAPAEPATTPVETPKTPAEPPKTPVEAPKIPEEAPKTPVKANKTTVETPKTPAETLEVIGGGEALEPAALGDVKYSKLVFTAAHGYTGKTARFVKFQSYTNAGDVEADKTQNEYITLSALDETAPALDVAYSTTEPTGGAVVATVAFADAESGVATVTEDGESLTSPTSPLQLKFDENGSKTVVVTNGAGMASTQTITVGNIDKAKIVENTHYSVGYRYKDHEGWKELTDFTKPYAQVKAVVTPVANIGKTLSVTNNGGLFEKILIKQEDHFTFMLADTVGQTKEVPVKYEHFDDTPGTTKWVLSSTEKTNKPITATVTLKDDNGIAFAEVKDSGGVVCPWETEVLKAENKGEERRVKFSKSDSYTITAFDNAGNSWSEVIAVTNVDIVVPKINWDKVTYSTPPGTYTAKSVNVTVGEFTKKNVVITGVTPQEPLKTGEFLYVQGSNSVRFLKNGVVTITFQDEFGNVGTGKLSVGNIYAVAPTLEAVPVLADDKLSVDITFKQQTDKGAPIDILRQLTDLSVTDGRNTYSADKAKFTIKANGSYNFTVFDAGTSQNIVVKVTGIDMVAPIISNVTLNYDYLNVLDDWKPKAATKSITPGTEAGYVIATDKENQGTNQDVTVTVTTDKVTKIFGSKAPYTNKTSMIYKENGLFNFNMEAKNGTTASYGVDVELIDKVPPILKFKGNPELIFIQDMKPDGKDPSYAYDATKFYDYEAYDVMNGEKVPLSKVTIDFGTFNKDDVTKNKFDRTSPYYIYYTVYDAAGNCTRVRRTVRLIGFYDTIALINDEMPDSANTTSIATKDLTLSLKNFSGISYARYESGIWTMGQMKSKGTVMVGKNGTYTLKGLANGWYTVYVQTDKRDYFNILVYVNSQA